MELTDIINKLKPEHADVVNVEMQRLQAEIEKAATLATDLQTAQDTLTATTDELAKANEEIATLKAKVECKCDGEVTAEGACATCGKPVEKKLPFDEEETMKSMPAEARELIAKIRLQKEAAEEELRKAKEAETHAKAVAKAAELKALPVSTDVLVGVIKSCSPDMVDMLSSINSALDGVVLTEVGKSHKGNNSSADAWGKIEQKAVEIAKERSVTQQKAISLAVKENPDLYKEYLSGGAK